MGKSIAKPRTPAKTARPTVAPTATAASAALSAPATSAAIRGSAKIRMDEKGRLSIPARFHGFFDASGVATLTLSPLGCLLLYSNAHFETVAERIAAMGNIQSASAHIEEVIIGCAEQVELDRTGRLMVSAHLRERARFTPATAVLAFAVGDSMRLWDEGEWEKQHAWFVSQQLEEGMSEAWKDLRI